MIAITIKTLDSRNHEFSFEEDLTVKQLKEMIAESVSVPAESQRLIYCGRVLLDDKKLSEYDVNGKVIHLVQRAPPSTSGSSSSTTSSSTPRNERSSGRSRLDNAMYLGAMAFPADLMEAQGLTVPPPRHTLSHSRLGVARSMLARASAVLQTLEGRSDSTSHEASASGSASPVETLTPNEPGQDTTIQAEVTVPSESDPGGLRASDIAAAAASDIAAAAASDIAAAAASDIAAAAAQAVTAALDHALSVHHGGNVSITLNNSDGNGPDDLIVRVTQGNTDSNSTSSSGTSGNAGPRQRPAQRTTALAELVQQLRDVQMRMQPFLDRYYNLMQNDPPDASDNQDVFNSVSELMHLLAHAYHALSDIMCDLSQAPPRVLRCRPVLIQHSAVLQTGIPIQVPAAQIINFSTQPSPASSQMENASHTEGQSAQSQPRPEETNTSETLRSEAQRARRQAEEILLNGLRPDRPSGAERGPTATVSISPSNFEIFMDVSSGTFSLDSLDATILGGSAPSSSNTSTAPPTPSTTTTTNTTPQQPPSNQGNTNSNSSSGENPWGQAPPNDFIHSLLQRIYGEMSNIHNNNYNPNNNNRNQQQSSSSANSSSAPNSSANSSSADNESGAQREGTPVSSSQSIPRATFSSRPHIHIGPSIGSGPLSSVDFFDPFLPCNSHHIRGRRNRSMQNTSSTLDSNQSTDSPSTSSHPTLQIQTILAPGNRRSIVQHILPAQPREILRTLQSLSSGSGDIMRTTVAQLLAALPGHPYQFGQSVILDFFITAGRFVLVQDLLGDGSRMLGWMRPGLRSYVETTLGVDSACSESAIQSAIDRINTELTSFFETSFQDLTIRQEIDLPASIRKVSQTYLPQLIKDIHQADNFNYIVNVSNHVLKFIHEVISVLAFASNTTRSNLDAVIFAFVTKLVGLVDGNTEEDQTRLVGEMSGRLRRVIRPFDFARETYRTFIVNIPAPQQTNSTQPMEIDGIEEGIVADVITSTLSDRETDREPLPHVIIGSEPWHHTLPPDWVPIITRDRERQRRGAAQSPLSDAYLAGMPSKRRKLITDNKPNTSLNKVISESMGRALGAAGLATTATAELVEAASCDTGLRNAYKQQVRTSVESTLRSHPDYHPDKYPNTAKYFNRLR